MKTKIIYFILICFFTLYGFSQECGTPNNKPNLDYGQQRQAAQALNEGPIVLQ